MYLQRPLDSVAWFNEVMIYGSETLHRVSKYMFIANNRNTRVECEICSNFYIKFTDDCVPKSQRWYLNDAL